jgi:hypothetical protein
MHTSAPARLPARSLLGLCSVYPARSAWFYIQATGQAGRGAARPTLRAWMFGALAAMTDKQISR